MSYDLSFRIPDAETKARVTAWLDEHPDIQRDGDEATYRNDVTFTEFGLRLDEDALAVEVNYLRPFVFASEVGDVLNALCEACELSVEDDPQVDGIEDEVFFRPHFLRGWWSGNLFAYTSSIKHRLEADDEDYPPLVTYDTLVRIAEWNQEQVESGALQLADVDGDTMVAATVLLEGENVLLPEAGAYVFVREGDVLGSCLHDDIADRIDLGELEIGPDDSAIVPTALLNGLAEDAGQLELDTLYPWQVWETEIADAAFLAVEAEGAHDAELLANHRAALGVEEEKVPGFDGFTDLRAFVRRPTDDDTVEVVEEHEASFVIRVGWEDVDRVVAIDVAVLDVDGSRFLSLDALIAPKGKITDAPSVHDAADRRELRVTRSPDGTVRASRWVLLGGLSPETFDDVLSAWAASVDDLRVDLLGEEEAAAIDRRWQGAPVLPAVAAEAPAPETKRAAFTSPAQLVDHAIRGPFRVHMATFNTTGVRLTFVGADDVETSVVIVCVMADAGWQVVLSADLDATWDELPSAKKHATSPHGWVASGGTEDPAAFKSQQPLAAFDREGLAAYVTAFAEKAAQLQRASQRR